MAMTTDLFDHGLTFDNGTSDITRNILNGSQEQAINFKPIPKASILKKPNLNKFGEVDKGDLSMKSKKHVYFDITHIEEHQIEDDDGDYEENGDVNEMKNGYNQIDTELKYGNDSTKQNGDIDDIDTLEIADDKLNEAIEEKNTPLSAFKLMIAEEKKKLKRELELFQSRCRKELSAMKQELGDRRELFLLESEELDALAFEQRQQIESELAELQAELNLNKKRQSYQAKEDRLKFLEGDLERRAQNAKEYKQEIIEMEEYLNRRHQIWHDKTMELKEKDKELSEYEKEINDRKDKLKGSGIDLDNSDNIVINELQKKVQELSLSLQNTKESLYRTESESKDKDLTISSMQAKLDEFTNDNRNLHQKTRHLESQLSITIEEIKQMKKKPGSGANIVTSTVSTRGRIFRRSRSLDTDTIKESRRKSTMSVACSVM